MTRQEIVPRQNYEGDFGTPAQPPESISPPLMNGDVALNGLSVTLGGESNTSRLMGTNLASRLQNFTPFGRKPFGNNVPATFVGGNVSKKEVPEEALRLATASPEQTTQFYSDT